MSTVTETIVFHDEAIGELDCAVTVQCDTEWVGPVGEDADHWAGLGEPSVSAVHDGDGNELDAKVAADWLHENHDRIIERFNGKYRPF